MTPPNILHPYETEEGHYEFFASCVVHETMMSGIKLGEFI
jgi:hypothetical protein